MWPRLLDGRVPQSSPRPVSNERDKKTGQHPAVIFVVRTYQQRRYQKVRSANNRACNWQVSVPKVRWMAIRVQLSVQRILLTTGNWGMMALDEERGDHESLS